MDIGLALFCLPVFCILLWRVYYFHTSFVVAQPILSKCSQIGSDVSQPHKKIVLLETITNLNRISNILKIATLGTPVFQFIKV